MPLRTIHDHIVMQQPSAASLGCSIQCTAYTKACSAHELHVCLRQTCSATSCIGLCVLDCHIECQSQNDGRCCYAVMCGLDGAPCSACLAHKGLCSTAGCNCVSHKDKGQSLHHLPMHADNSCSEPEYSSCTGMHLLTGSTCCCLPSVRLFKLYKFSIRWFLV